MYIKIYDKFEYYFERADRSLVRKIRHYRCFVL